MKMSQNNSYQVFPLCVALISLCISLSITVGYRQAIGANIPFWLFSILALTSFPYANMIKMHKSTEDIVTVVGQKLADEEQSKYTNALREIRNATRFFLSPSLLQCR